MQRRDFMKAALAAAVAPSAIAEQTLLQVPPKVGTIAPGPLPWMQGLDHGDLAAVTTLNVEEIAQPTRNFFSDVQRAALIRLSEVLVPARNGHPGAIEAKVPDFLDFYIGKSTPDIRHMYQSGLDWLNTEAKSTYGMMFAELDDHQADAILKPRLASWLQDHYPTGKDERFVNAAHHDIRRATLNSPAWAAASAEHSKRPYRGEVYWYPIEPDTSRALA